jgi:hypothetical protein
MLQVKSNLPHDVLERRRKLAQLLRVLRRIRHQHPSREQLIESFASATEAAGDVVRFLRIILPVGDHAYRRVRFRVDKRALYHSKIAS